MRIQRELEAIEFLKQNDIILKHQSQPLPNAKRIIDDFDISTFIPKHRDINSKKTLIALTAHSKAYQLDSNASKDISFKRQR